MGAGIRLEPRLTPLVLNSFLALLLLYYAAIRLPLAGFILTAIVPLPIILVSRGAGFRWGLTTVGAALVFILGLRYFLGAAAEVMLFGQMAAAGLLLAFLEGRGHAIEVTIGLTVLVMALINGAAFAFYLVNQGLNPWDYLNRTVQELLGYLTAFMQKEGGSLDELLPAGVDKEVFGRFLIRLSPALMLMNSTLIVWLNLLLSRLVPSLVGEEDKAPLSTWEAPGWLIFVFIGAGFLILYPLDWVQTLGLNLLLLCALAYFFQGLAIVSHTFQRYQVPRLLRFMIYPWLVLLKPAVLVVVVLGLTDLWLDFRRLHLPPVQNGGED